MKNAKKNSYLVKCVVNMDASHTEVVRVHTTKPHLAIMKAESTLLGKGFFHAKAFTLTKCE